MKVRQVISPEGRVLREAIGHLTNSGVKVGWFAKSAYDDKHKTPVASAAVSNEFGNPLKHVPARPFMRPTVIQQEQAWAKLVTDGAKKVLKNTETIPNVLNLLGSRAVGDIKKTIKKVYYPALAESTVLARIEKNKGLSSKKGRLSEKSIGNITKPLIDTGIMFNTITHELTES